MAQPDHVVPAHEKYGLPLAFEHASNSLITGGFDGSLGIWSTDDWSERRLAEGHDQSVNCGGLTANGQLVTGSTDTTAKLWALPGLDCVSTLEGHAKTVADLATHPSDRRVATASYDSTVRVWNTDADGEPQVLDVHSGNVTCVEFLGNGEQLASGGIGEDVVIWSVEEGAELARIGGHGQAVVGVTVDSDGRVWSAGYDGTLHRWAAEDWSVDETFELPIDTPPAGLAAHPSEPVLAVPRGGGVTLVSTQGELVTDHETSIKGIYTPLWSPDGEWLAVGGADGTVRTYRYR